MKELNKLKTENKILKIKRVEPDLSVVDGIIMDKIKLTSRKISDIIEINFNEFTKEQATYLIHLTMNNFFNYYEELEIYSTSLISIKNALGIK